MVGYVCWMCLCRVRCKALLEKRRDELERLVTHRVGFATELDGIIRRTGEGVESMVRCYVCGVVDSLVGKWVNGQADRQMDRQIDRMNRQTE